MKEPDVRNPAAADLGPGLVPGVWVPDARELLALEEENTGTVEQRAAAIAARARQAAEMANAKTPAIR